jgi:orotate phosphoribosyltransferase
VPTSTLVSLEGTPLEILTRCGGYYACPKASDGRRSGLLVGYAGRYDDHGTAKQYVGEVYVNVAAADQYPYVMYYFAEATRGSKLKELAWPVDVFCGAPLGGYTFADMLGLVYDRRVCKAEKKVTAIATAETREQSRLVFARSAPQSGDRVAIVEDVCNNFSTTEQLIELILAADASPVAIVCFLNRSPRFDDTYPSDHLMRLPIISLVRQPIDEWRQDDPVVADDVAAGKVVWKPKNEWPRLMAAMQAATPAQ